MSLTAPVNVTVDGDNSVVMSVQGQTMRFVEVEPGLLQDRADPDNRMVLREADGQVYLVPATPFVFIEAPWHRSLGLHLLILIGGAVVFLGAVVGWGMSFAGGLRRREPRELGGRLARLAGALFGLVFLGFIVALGIAFGTVDPAYGVPSVFFGIPRWLQAAMYLPWLAALLAVAVALCAGLAWWKRYWNAAGRVVYSGLAVWALAIVWSIAYWNLL